MQELNESNFDENTKEGLVLVDFYTPSCGPCRAMAPVLGQLTGINVVKVDVAENMSLALKYKFSSVPTFVFLREGQEVYRTSGFQSKDNLQKKIDELNAQ